MSYSELAQMTESDPKTVSKYIDILEKAFIVFRLGSYSRNLRNELRKSRKVYFGHLADSRERQHLRGTESGDEHERRHVKRIDHVAHCPHPGPSDASYCCTAWPRATSIARNPFATSISANLPGCGARPLSSSDVMGTSCRAAARSCSARTRLRPSLPRRRRPQAQPAIAWHGRFSPRAASPAASGTAARRNSSSHAS